MSDGIEQLREQIRALGDRVDRGFAEQGRRMDELRQDMVSRATELREAATTRLNDHAGRIRAVEIDQAENKGADKGARESFFRTVKLFGLLWGVAVAAASFLARFLWNGR